MMIYSDIHEAAAAIIARRERFEKESERIKREAEDRELLRLMYDYRFFFQFLKNSGLSFKVEKDENFNNSFRLVAMQAGRVFLKQRFMKTEEEINELKQSWLFDPIWDIEDTEGFEEHAAELKAFRIKIRAKRDAAENARIADRCTFFGIGPELLQYIEGLEYQIERLEKVVNRMK